MGLYSKGREKSHNCRRVIYWDYYYSSRGSVIDHRRKPCTLDSNIWNTPVQYIISITSIPPPHRREQTGNYPAGSMKPLDLSKQTGHCTDYRHDGFMGDLKTPLGTAFLLVDQHNYSVDRRQEHLQHQRVGLRISRIHH